jgi:hypothetical protein
MHKIEVNTQVLHKRKSQHGNLVRIGTVMSFADSAKTKALVSFPGSQTRELVLVSTLEPASEKFHKARVQINPLQRAISQL